MKLLIRKFKIVLLVKSYKTWLYKFLSVITVRVINIFWHEATARCLNNLVICMHSKAELWNEELSAMTRRLVFRLLDTRQNEEY